MAHGIETNGGKAAFVSAHQSAWHRLGETVDHTMTAEEVMVHGHLGGWNVRKLPLQTTVPETGEILSVPEFATVRNNPFKRGQVDVLGRVGGVYHVVQNEEHTALLDALVDESGAHFETAGSLRGGRQVFVTMKLPGHIKIGGVDRVDNYIAAVNSHDGSMKFTIMVTPIRVVCANTLNLAFGNHSHQFTARHTEGAQKTLVTEARKALEVSFSYLEGFQKEAEQLINTTMTQIQFEEMVHREFGADIDAHPTVQTRANRRVDEMLWLFNHSYTHEGLRDTAWAGLNTLTEWADHMSPVRGQDRDTTRATKSLMDPSFKNKALALVKAAVS